MSKKCIYEFRNIARIREVFNDIDHLKENAGIVTVCLRKVVRLPCRRQTVPEFIVKIKAIKCQNLSMSLELSLQKHV